MKNTIVIQVCFHITGSQKLARNVNTISFLQYLPALESLSNSGLLLFCGLISRTVALA